MTGIEDITYTFAAAGLGAPPVPPRLAPALVRMDDWLWSTRDVDRGGLYDPPELTDDSMAHGPDYVAVGTSGHGMNSYFLTCRAVVGPVALFVQEGWGGAYMDEAKQAFAIAELFQGALTLLTRAEELPTVGRRLLVLASPVKGLNVCQWVPMDGRTRREVAVPSGDWPTRALDVALTVLADDSPAVLLDGVPTTVRLDWEEWGSVEDTERGPWVAGLPKGPALYRLRFVNGDGPWVYIGETMNVARRIVHYRTGDPDLRTNAWIHGLLVEHLAARKAVELDVALKGSVTVAGLTRELRLDDKLDRRLAEAAAINAVPRDALLNKR